MLLKNLYNIDVTQRKELDKMVKEHTRESIPMLQPQPSNDIVSVLETRNINFNKSFTQEFCDEVIELLDKVQVYDELTNREKYIRITLSTPGGSILEKIEKLKSKGYIVHTHCKSMAASCGFVLFVSGNKRTISPFGFLLNHQGSSMMSGTVRDMEISLELTKKLEKQINDYIRTNTELSEDEIQRPYRTNTDIWYTAQEALELKLASEIISY